MWGHEVIHPYEEYGGNLPKIPFVSRAGIETLLRRLILDKDKYTRIRQIIGTATGASRSTTSPQSLGKVAVRTSDGVTELSAALVIG